MKICLFTAIILLLGFSTYAQNFDENALLFSRTMPGGSARMQAMGGAQVSLGGDYSSALSNPAGLGMYNRSEFTFSPGINFANTSTSYLGTTTDKSNAVFNIPGLSYVYHHETGNEDGFLGGSLGISMTRINDLHRHFSYSGVNNQSSIIDYFIEDANASGYTPSQFLNGDAYYSLTGLAYNNFLIEDAEDNNGNLFYGSALNPQYDLNEVRTLTQKETSDQKGAQYRWSISYGANFNDKFFIGGGIGITTLRYKLKQRYEESNFQFSEDATYNPLDNFYFEEDTEIRGSGVNLSLGLVYRPIDLIQIGASFTSPTYYQLTDTYTANMRSDWNDFSDEYANFDVPIISEYNITTPLKGSVGASIFIFDNGLLSADVEFVNYGKAKYSSNTDDVSFDVDNKSIQAKYRNAVNYRIGGEYRYDIFRLRAGYNFMDNPFINDEGIDRTIKAFSAGVGIRKKSFFIDLAVIHSQSKGRRIPYATESVTPTASQTSLGTNFIITVGFPFQ